VQDDAGTAVQPHGDAELARLLQAERDARAAAERSARRLAELQAVTAGLSRARTPDQVAEVIVERATGGSGAASGALCLLSDDGRSMEVARSVGYDEAAIARFRTFPLASDLPAADALRTRRIVLVGSIAERERLYPELGAVPARNQAFALVPVFAGDDPVGAIALGWAEQKTFSEDDVRFLDAIGQQAGQALDRARFYAAEHETAVRQGFLAEASRVLSSSLDYEETLARVARLAVPGIADACTVYLVDEAGLRLMVTAHVDPASEAILRQRMERGRASTNPLLLGIVESGEPVLLAELSDTSWEQLAQDPDELEVLRRLGVRSALAVPLSIQERRIGVLALVMGRSDRHYRAADLAFVEDLAGRAAVAIENSRAQQARADVVRTLQRSLLPHTLPLLPGLEIAGRYHPVGGRSEVGGDFYDVFPLGRGRWGAAIGDVCGKGVMAAQLTALARYTVRTAARSEARPSGVLDVLNRSLLDHETGDRFCTIVTAFIDTAEEPVRVTLSCAGHPLPLLIDAAGTVSTLGRSGTAVGLFATPALFDDTHRLLPGETLVLYTDGVVEARAPDGSFADGLLEAVLHRCHGQPADAIAASVESAMLEFQGGHPRDDMAVLVVSAPGPRFRERLAPVAESLTASRRRLRTWLEATVVASTTGDRAQVVDDVLLVAGELGTNAVQAARTTVELRAWTGPGSIIVEVTDDGLGFDGVLPPLDAVPDPSSQRGRGLFLVQALTQECRVQSASHGTLIRCAIPL
jgi:serine phosphatase RsbU (regulator of sigma subunit)/anti-sigma regulatory factor (Ser/Thr protein kinase)